MVASVPITVQSCSTCVFFCTDMSYFDPTASTDRFLAAEKKVLYEDFSVSSTTAQNMKYPFRTHTAFIIKPHTEPAGA